MFRATDRDQLSPEEAIELLIVAAGARADLGQRDAAVAMLQVRELTSDEPWVARLRYAYADALLAVGRNEEAREWFARAAEVDEDAATDAAERLLELDGVVLDDPDEDDDFDALEEDEDEGADDSEEEDDADFDDEGELDDDADYEEEDDYEEGDEVQDDEDEDDEDEDDEDEDEDDEDEVDEDEVDEDEDDEDEDEDVAEEDDEAAADADTGEPPDKPEPTAP